VVLLWGGARSLFFLQRRGAIAAAALHGASFCLNVALAFFFCRVIERAVPLILAS
jgi:hypothetical protein